MRNLAITLIASILTTSILAQPALNRLQEEGGLDSRRLELIYENDFASIEVGSWQLEGPGRVYTVTRPDGHAMVMHALIYQEMRAAWESNARQPLHLREQYYPGVEAALRQTAPHRLDEIRGADGLISGGHIVLWNKDVMLPDSYAITYTFKPHTPIGLAILFFSAHAAEGGDIFKPGLNQRSGVFAQYNRGDINSYHISFWANNAAVGVRGTSNLRKNSGFFNIASGVDPSVVELDWADESFEFKAHTIELVKVKNHIRFYIDGHPVIDFIDRRVNDLLGPDGRDLGRRADTGPYHQGGRFGFRQMVSLSAEYRDLKIYRIHEE